MVKTLQALPQAEWVLAKAVGRGQNSGAVSKAERAWPSSWGRGQDLGGVA